MTVYRSEKVLNLANKILWFSQTDTRTEAEGYSDADTQYKNVMITPQNVGTNYKYIRSLMYSPTTSSLKDMMFFRMDEVGNETQQSLYNSYTEKRVETTNTNAKAEFNPEINTVDFEGLYFR